MTAYIYSSPVAFMTGFHGAIVITITSSNPWQSREDKGNSTKDSVQQFLNFQASMVPSSPTILNFVALQLAVSATPFVFLKNPAKYILRITVIFLDFVVILSRALLSFTAS